ANAGSSAKRIHSFSAGGGVMNHFPKLKRGLGGSEHGQHYIVDANVTILGIVHQPVSARAWTVCLGIASVPHHHSIVGEIQKIQKRRVASPFRSGLQSR